MSCKALAVLVVMTLAVAGCGSSTKTTRPSNPLCASSGCSSVTGVVRTCHGPRSVRCRSQPVATVELLDHWGRLSQKAFGADGHAIRRFTFGALSPDRYTLKTRAMGRVWTQSVHV